MDSATVNSLDAYWMPFTSNRRFKQSPRLFVASRKLDAFDLASARLAHERVVVPTSRLTPDGRVVDVDAGGVYVINAGGADVTTIVQALDQLDSVLAAHHLHMEPLSSMQ